MRSSLKPSARKVRILCSNVQHTIWTQMLTCRMNLLTGVFCCCIVGTDGVCCLDIIETFCCSYIQKETSQRENNVKLLFEM